MKTKETGITKGEESSMKFELLFESKPISNSSKDKWACLCFKRTVI